jgi:hypothetical protein
MTARAFLKWYANYVLEFIKDIDFDCKVTFVTFSAMIPIVIILGISHVDVKVGFGVVFGTLLSVGVLLILPTLGMQRISRCMTKRSVLIVGAQRY